MPESSQPNPTDEIVHDKFTRGIIRRKARQIINRPGMSEQDVPAIEQTILAHVVEAMSSFDSAIAHRNIFVTTVVERFVKSFLRNQQRMKSGSGRVQSLNVDVIVPGEGRTDLQNTLEESTRNTRLQIERRPDDEMRELVADMAQMIATLPEPWQRMLELRKSHSLTRVSELMGVPRRTLRDWMKQVAQRFEEAGLRDYMA